MKCNLLSDQKEVGGQLPSPLALWTSAGNLLILFAKEALP